VVLIDRAELAQFHQQLEHGGLGRAGHAGSSPYGIALTEGPDDSSAGRTVEHVHCNNQNGRLLVSVKS
jgi:hypothetical protein